ncbi:MAG: sulfate transporter CysZ [Magnetococcales bacterium]|nr:sulfate transporter CysZ [Magnetococcales bacterium]
MTDPIKGFFYLFRGLGLIFKPGLRRFVFLPLLLNSLLFGFGTWYGFGWYELYIGQFTEWLPSWLRWLEWLLLPLFFIGAAVIVFFLFALVANLIAAPFNGLLAERVEGHLMGRGLEGGPGGGVLKRLVPAIWNELSKWLYFLRWAILLLIITLIPVVNVAAPIFWMLFTAWMFTVEYADYPLGNHNLSGKQVRRRLGTSRMMSLGFGFAVMLATLIPGVNFLAMPAAVAGATAMWVDRFSKVGE